MRLSRLLFLLAWMIPTATALAQSGKISGVVRDATTNDPLPGVNVVIVGTTQGGVTDLDGFYFVNNVRPGTYTLQVSFIGYTTETQGNVRVSNGLTTEVNFGLQPTQVGLDEVTVVAERPIVQADVSANVASLQAGEIEDLPIASVTDAIGLQAGIQNGLEIRGGGANELAFVVDGLNLRGGRDQQPLTNISFTALEEVQVQTGGFNAEYGNVRSGVINVTTKDPSRERYTFDGIFRYTPDQDLTLNQFDQLGDCEAEYASGNVSSGCDAWWVRPFLDPETRYSGSGNWDSYTARQYREFSGGWDAISTRLQGEGFDVTSDELIEYYKYTHRKDNNLDIPDYDADFTFGGPVPGVSQALGNLRFLFSYRGLQRAMFFPQTRDRTRYDTFQGKLTSDLAKGVKLTLHTMVANERGVVGDNETPFAFVVERGTWSRNDGGQWLWGDAYISSANVDNLLLGGTLTHTLNARTFYEVTLQNLNTKYRHVFPNTRDASFWCPEDGIGPDGTECTPGQFVTRLYTDNFGASNPLGLASGELQCFGGNSDLNADGDRVPYCVGEEPFGFSGIGGNLLDFTETGAHSSKTRDTSNVNIFTGRFDLTSQVNRLLQVKTGIELIASNYDIRAQRSQLELGFTPDDYPWSRQPIQGAIYSQGKLEFKGMIANLGIRGDYFNTNQDWWDLESSPYSQALAGNEEALNADTSLAKIGASNQFYLSPRLGISFPITENSKLYFNYGHFRQQLDDRDLFGIESRRDRGIEFIGYPDHPMQLTVAYELGYDQNLFDQFLLRVSGFYRDVRNQRREVTFNALESVNYITARPWNYEDIRGAEFTLTKNRGKWIQGFLNYTFLQTKEGNFGYGQFNENLATQRAYLLNNQDYRLFAPLARPYARLNLLFLTPRDFGPANGQLLGDWRISFLGNWQAGAKTIWNDAQTFPELRENVQWRDWWNFDLRFTKHINTRAGETQLFVDVTNVFNIRHFDAGTTVGPQDDRLYMRSLHLPEDTFDSLERLTCTSNPDADPSDCPFSDKEGLPYLWVPGDDRPGMFRDDDVAFQPIEAVASLANVAEADRNNVAWYWAKDTGTYSRWNGSAWQPVDEGELQEALDNKAYIDMPNRRFENFILPRRVSLGLRFTF